MNEKLTLEEKEIKKQSKIVLFVNACLRNENVINFIISKESLVQNQITSFVEVLLTGICLLKTGKAKFNLI